ncbi:hypothetical protein NQF87_06440 [Bombella sp. TMW 2.2559]|uniref:Uncharacterized protein n=1 Tax=Bombella dulcis TaxID=2967339 RepID=A0ABT3WFL6_9PROT|nr:hypothetical protein [Bombella dulcis]MCX5616607.1 hypothetical protein [Bombella dulcis]
MKSLEGNSDSSSQIAQKRYPSAIRKLFKKFLFYRYCVALQRPLIIPEGKTDSVYLREAVKKRVDHYPVLGGFEGGNFKHGVNYFNYDSKLVHEVMDMRGGTADLSSFMRSYVEHSKNFIHKPMKYPVILVVDNDDGLKKLKDTVRKYFRVQLDINTKESFYHLCENLYLVKTPEDGGETYIEDLFPEKWCNYELNGKRLDTSNSKIDVSKFYGKAYFANYVVKPNASKIDFSGFDSLLDRISLAIIEYSKKDKICE